MSLVPFHRAKLEFDSSLTGHHCQHPQRLRLQECSCENNGNFVSQPCLICDTFPCSFVKVCRHTRKSLSRKQAFCNVCVQTDAFPTRNDPPGEEDAC